MTTAITVCPIYAEPYYTYSIDLEGISYQLTFRWNGRALSWYLDLATRDNLPIILGMRLVPNYPMMYDFNFEGLTGYFGLVPKLEANLGSFETDPYNIVDLFTLGYVYQT